MLNKKGIESVITLRVLKVFGFKLSLGLVSPLNVFHDDYESQCDWSPDLLEGQRSTDDLLDHLNTEARFVKAPHAFSLRTR